MPRRVPRPRPQSRRCRYTAGGQRCASIAGPSGFCQRCERLLEDDMGERRGGATSSAIDDLIKGLFGVGNVSARRTREAGVEVITEHLHRRFPGLRGDQPPAQPGQPTAPPRAPGGRVSPEAIARRKANLAARGVLGFEPDESLTEAIIRERRRTMIAVWNTNDPNSRAGNHEPATRELMLRKINDAATLLINAAKPAPPR